MLNKILTLMLKLLTLIALFMLSNAFAAEEDVKKKLFRQ